jgi:hypothetical protein
MLVTSKANTKNARLSTNHLDTSLILRYIFAFPCREHTHGQNGGSVNIAEEYASRRVAEAAVKKQWEDVAMHLAKRIPASCRTFGEKQNWIRSDNPALHSSWILPASLEGWIVRMEKYGFALLVNIRSDELDNTGFTDMEDALKKLRSLQRAWRDHIRMVLQSYKSKGKIDLIRMTFYMRGFEWSEEEYLRGFKTRTQNEN